MKEKGIYFYLGQKPSECQLDAGLTRTYLGDYFRAQTLSVGYLFLCASASNHINGYNNNNNKIAQIPLWTYESHAYVILTNLTFQFTSFTRSVVFKQEMCNMFCSKMCFHKATKCCAGSVLIAVKYQETEDFSPLHLSPRVDYTLLIWRSTVHSRLPLLSCIT